MKISDKILDDALHSPAVRGAVRARANALLPRVRAVAYSANAPALARALEVVEGTRPGSKARGGLRRPYARVEAEVTPAVRAEMRTAKLSPRKILRRGGGNG